MTPAHRAPQLMERIVRAQQRTVLGRFARQLAYALGLDIPKSVEIGEDFRIYHRGIATVVHPNTVFGDRCRVFHGVTLGRADIERPETVPPRFIIEDDVWLCAGAVVLARTGETRRIARGTIVGANAVLTCDTNPGDVWVGNPARKA